jgi:hypothetical protein
MDSVIEEYNQRLRAKCDHGYWLPWVEREFRWSEAKKSLMAPGAGRKMSMRERIKKRSGGFEEVLLEERHEVLRSGPKGWQLALNDAYTRLDWDQSFRNLQDGFQKLEATRKSPPNKIVTAIPADDIAATARRVEQAIKYLARLHKKLIFIKKERTAPGNDEAACLDNIIEAARRADIRKYGRAKPARVFEAVGSEVSAAQIELVRGGRYGEAMKASAERWDILRQRAR